MNQESMKLVRESIKNCGDNRTTLEAKIERLEKETMETEGELFRVNNVRKSLEAALKSLEEAEEKGKAPIGLSGASGVNE